VTVPVLLANASMSDGTIPPVKVVAGHGHELYCNDTTEGKFILSALLSKV
jgi:hypothetical protein